MSHASRMTKQRALILKELKNVDTHPSADEVCAMVRAKLPRISLGTVYRNLEFLSEKNLALKLEYAGFQKRFDGNPKPHLHIRCERCGKVADVMQEIATPDFSNAVEVPGFTVTRSKIEFFGICDACKK